MYLAKNKNSGVEFEVDQAKMQQMKTQIFISISFFIIPTNSLAFQSLRFRVTKN